MPHVIRLLTVADIAPDSDARRVSVRARHEAVLDDGRRVVLLDDRGWSAELRGPGSNEIADIWTTAAEQEIVETARQVVGPDEPFGDHTYASMAAGHWSTLADTLRRHGVMVDPVVLAQLPHDVEISDRLRGRLAQRP